MANIFISYRRSDSAGHSGRLFDALQRRLGDDNLFRDIEDLEPGVDFPEALNRALSRCEAMLVVIGPSWVSAPGPTGRRLEKPDDFVRVEVATALTRKDVRVIPVLVGGATMPEATDLPQDLQPLVARNAIELSDSRWDYDVSRLGDTLAKHLNIGQTPAAASKGRSMMMMGGGIAGVVLIGLLWIIFGGGNAPADATSSESDVTEADESAGTESTSEPRTFTVGDLEWTVAERDVDLDWSEALAYCNELALAGAEWRLPTIEELHTIYDPNDVDTFGYKMMRPFHEGVSHNQLWSSDKDTATAAFAFDFIEGENVSLAVNENRGALCVSPTTSG